MLYLTYRTSNDGLGGQYQRIIGLMALAMKHQCRYVHNPILQIEHIPTPQTEYLKRIEDFFQIKNYYSSIDEYHYDEVVDFERISEPTILSYKEKAHNSHILLKISIPNAILDGEPSVYNLILPQLRQIKGTLPLPLYSSAKKNIALHIRRGDVNEISHPGRFTPISVFHQIADKLAIHYPDSNICIFTEITPENKNEFNIFRKEIKIVANEDVLTTLEYLIQADILVMCKSSFSYIAGLYNKNQVIYMDFWHSPMPHWGRVTIN